MSGTYIAIKRANCQAFTTTQIKNLPANAGDARDAGSVPGSGRSPGEWNGNPLQYSCLENPKDGGDWRATASGVMKGGTRLSMVHSTMARDTDRDTDASYVLIALNSFHTK